MIVLDSTRLNFDYIIVGAGPFGCVCAHELTQKGKKCLVIDKRWTVGGNCYTENDNGIHIHKYGAHIFHTNDKRLWDYVNKFAEFRQYTHNVIADFKGERFTLPFNMWTFNQLWNVNDPESAKEKLEQTKYLGMVSNLEEQAVSMVGTEIYQKLIKGYTEKQWNKDCKDLPPSIIKRIPVRFTWDSNYFDDKYTGMPIGGYTQIFEKMLEGVEVRLGIDFFDYREILEKQTQKIIYTGPIDRFFDYKFGKLEYRSLKWNTKRLDIDNFQGIPVVNYTDRETPYTRIIEHKWFDPQNQKGTIISYEFPEDYNGDNEPYYPIRDEKNSMIFDRYNNLAKLENKYIFGGRLASYVYYDMHQVIAQALKLTNDLSNS